LLRKETIKKIINETIKYIKYDKKNERNELLKSVYEWIDFSDSGLLEAFEQMCHDYQVEIDRKLMNNQKLEMTKIVFKDNWETQKNLFEQYVILKNRINDCKEPEKLSELKREQKRLKDKLFNDNMWMVDYFLKHGFYPMIPKEDVKQIGYLILNENIDKFNYKEVNNDFYSNLSSCFFNKLDDMVLKFLLIRIVLLIRLL